MSKEKVVLAYSGGLDTSVPVVGSNLLRLKGISDPGGKSSSLLLRRGWK